VSGSGYKTVGQSIKPRFRNANLQIVYVLNSCLKLLAVLHVSRAQGRSVESSEKYMQNILHLILNLISCLLENKTTFKCDLNIKLSISRRLVQVIPGVQFAQHWHIWNHSQ